MRLIEQLAELVGFHASYTGTFGDTVLATDEARSTLLQAMGFALDDESLQRSITTLKQQEWLESLPSVHIVNLEDQQYSIQISLPVSDKQGDELSTELSLHWKIDFDNEIATAEGDVCNEASSSIKINSLNLLTETTIDGQKYRKYSLPLPVLAQGYYQFNLNFLHITTSCPLIYAPKTCYTPQEASTNKIWGYTAQLYSLRSKNNWGIGDFSDLSQLVESSAEQQVSTIGLNPLHPLYQGNPAHRSPYSPSSRCFVNAIYIDVSKIVNFDSCQLAQNKVNSEQFQQRLSHAKSSDLVDYPAVASLKFEVIALLFEDFCLQSTDEHKQMMVDFTEFKKQQGTELLNFATFDALYEHFHQLDNHSYGWLDWPAAFHKLNSESVAEFKQTHAARIDYFCFVQWLAHSQLAAVSKLTQDKNMPVGLYLDLAVGCDGAGFDVWSDRELYVSGASIGAPPDNMNALGQNWGLTPVNPVALKQQGYQPLVKALRSSMQYAGAIRIDHILGLMRQYWVAPGMEADKGVYISFPWGDILRIIALESRRNNCIVIGEDLGNVPDGFSETIQNAGLLSFKVLFFERWQSGLFKRPENFPEQSVVTIATHDTATLSGWWQGRDLEWRQNLNLYPSEDARNAESNARAGERQNLIAALDDLEVIDMQKSPQQTPAVMNTELSIAVQKFLAKAPSHLQLIPLEDALELSEQVNIPGTIDQHPNWLQKLPVLVEDFWQTESVKLIARAMQVARPQC